MNLPIPGKSLNIRFKIASICLLPILSVTGCGPSPENSRVSAAAEEDIRNETPQFSVDAPKLREEFQAAEEESKTKYLQKVILVTGKIDTAKIQVSRSSSLSEVNLISGVTCYFASAHNPRIAGLKPSDAVTIKGRCESGGVSRVVLGGCSFQ